jgi:hypothetical protein
MTLMSHPEGIDQRRASRWMAGLAKRHPLHDGD